MIKRSFTCECSVLQDVSGSEVGVPKQHPRVFMARNQGHFGHRQAHLKKPADGFMPQIMEA